MTAPSVQKKKQRLRKASLLLPGQCQTVSFNANRPAPGPRGLAMEPVVRFATTRTRSKPKIGSQPPIIVEKGMTEARSLSFQADRTSAAQ